MGCGGSKMETGEDTWEGFGTIRRKVEDIRRRRFGSGVRLRKDSIVSTAGLLRPEEEEEDAATAATDEASHGESLRRDHVFRICGSASATPEDNNITGPSGTPTSTMATPPPVIEMDRTKAEEAEVLAAVPAAETDGAVRKPEKKRENEGKEKQDQEEEEEEGEAKKKKKEEGGDKDEGETEKRASGEKRVVGGPSLLSRGRSRCDEEELPGSPSFRVYFQGSVRESSDDDSVIEGTRKAGSTESKEVPGRNDSIGSSNYSEESEGKTSKNHRGKRFKALKRGPSAVYGLLHVGSCISHNSNHTNSSSHENHNEK